jgi:hypothetical protein
MTAETERTGVGRTGRGREERGDRGTTGGGTVRKTGKDKSPNGGRGQAGKGRGRTDRKTSEEKRGTIRGTGRDTGRSTKMRAVVRARDIRNGLIGETTRKIETINQGKATTKGGTQERRSKTSPDIRK